MLGKFFTRQENRPCPICGRAVPPQAVRCEGCGRTIAMPSALRHVKRDQVKLAPIRLSEVGRDEE